MLRSPVTVMPHSRLTVALEAEEQSFQLLERDALRFAADRPYRFSNMTSANARLLLMYRYLK